MGSLKVRAMGVACLAAFMAFTWLPSASASPKSAVLPELIAGVPHSHYAYVVGVSNINCDGGGCVTLTLVNVTGNGTSTRSLPTLSPRRGSLLGNLSTISFTSLSHGYAVLTSGTTEKLYVTTDGARTWRRAFSTTTGPFHPVAASSRRIYAVTEICSARGECRGDRLLRVSASGTLLTSTPLPLAGPGTGIGLAANGRDVWIESSYPTQTVLRSSNMGRTVERQPTSPSVGVGPCTLSARSDTHLWAQCSTGMNLIFLASTDAARHWRVLDTHGEVGGTAGGFFDPVSADLAYVDLGQSSPAPHDDLVRLTPTGTSTPVSRLGCSVVNGLWFNDRTSGIVACQRTSMTASAALLVTSNGGVTWRPYRY